MEVIIESDGTPRGTTVKTADGQELPSMYRVSWVQDWQQGDIPKATIEFAGTPANLVTDAEGFVVFPFPDGKRYRLVEEHLLPPTSTLTKQALRLAIEELEFELHCQTTDKQPRIVTEALAACKKALAQLEP